MSYSFVSINDGFGQTNTQLDGFVFVMVDEKIE